MNIIGGLIIYLISIIIYYGLPIFLIFKLIKWSVKIKREGRKQLFYLNIIFLFLVLSTLVTYSIINSYLSYDIKQFEHELDISIPKKYVLLRRDKLIYGPEFSTYIELKLDSVDVIKTITSAYNSTLILPSHNNGNYYFFQHKYKGGISAGLDPKTGVLTLHKYYSILIGIH